MTARISSLVRSHLNYYDKVQNAAYTVAAGFGGKGLTTGLYVLFFQGVYTYPAWMPFIGGHTYSLANWWNNWPIKYDISANWAGINLGGPGHFGTWVSEQWPALQYVFFKLLPISLIAAVAVGMLVSKGSLKKTNWFDHVTLFLHDHGLKFVPSRLQEESTTLMQYVMLPFTALLFGAIGALLLATPVIFGSIALIHAYHVSALYFLVPILNNSVVEIILLGVAGHKFFASAITYKPAEDAQAFFQDRHLDMSEDDIACLRAFRSSRGTPVDLLRALKALGGRKVVPGLIYPASYRKTYDDKLEGLVYETYTPLERSSVMKYTAPFGLIYAVALLLAGLYWSYWYTTHGGWRP